MSKLNLQRRNKQFWQVGGTMSQVVCLSAICIGVLNPLAGCGGGGKPSSTITPTPTATPTPTPTPDPSPFDEFPSYTSTLSVSWYPGLQVGGGFSLDKAAAGQAPALGNEVVRLATGSPITHNEVNESVSIGYSENGTYFDFGLEGRYLAYSGSIGYSNSTYSEIASSDFSFTVYYDQDHGKHAKKFTRNIFDALKAEYNANPVAFVNKYGTHYVSGADMHNYLRATYYISKVSSAAASSTGLKLSASGKWVVGSISGSATYSNTLKTLSSRMSLKVVIETNAQTVPLVRTISTPSDVDAVLAEIASIQNIAQGSNPVPYRFYLTPWADILGQNNGSVDNLQAIYSKIAKDYYTDVNLYNSLDVIVNDSARYDFLGSDVRSYYQAKYNDVVAETSRLRQILVDLKTNPAAGQNYQKKDFGLQFIVPPSVTFDPYVQNHHYLSVQAHVKGAGGTFRGRLSNGSQTIYSTSIQTESSGSLPSDNIKTVIFSRDYPSVHPLWNQPLNRVDGTGWNLEILDVQDNVVAIVPLPAQ